MFKKEYTVRYYQVEINNKIYRFLTLEVKDNKIYSLEKIIININKIKEILPKYEIVITYNSLDNKIQKAFIEHGIAYYTMFNEEIFLPFIYIHLNKNTSNISSYENKRSYFTPKEQLVFLHIVYNYKDYKYKEIDAGDIYDKTGVSITTIYKCLKILTEENIVKKIGVTKNAKYYFLDNIELENIVRNLLINPISNKTYYRKDELNKEMINYIYRIGTVSGESALAEFSLYSRPDIENFAFSKKNYRYITQKLNMISIKDEEIANFLAKNSDIICIEEWKYDPIKTATNGIVDFLSLYKILEQEFENNPRLHQEMDSIILNRNYD